MNHDELTLIDCAALYDFKGLSIVIKHGHVVGFVCNLRLKGVHKG